jgi:electron transfer flavoprotein alpha subunit
MLQLIDEVFATRQDPDQLQVSREQIEKLNEIHPAALTELSDENGPVIWVLLIPTTRAIMTAFVGKEISEKELLDKTHAGQSYDCIYLCSATTLPEYRGKGKTRDLCLKAIAAIVKDHPINTLFVWPFTKEGESLAGTLARACKLELLKRI